MRRTDRESSYLVRGICAGNKKRSKSFIRKQWRNCTTHRRLRYHQRSIKKKNGRFIENENSRHSFISKNAVITAIKASITVQQTYSDPIIKRCIRWERWTQHTHSKRLATDTLHMPIVCTDMRGRQADVTGIVRARKLSGTWERKNNMNVKWVRLHRCSDNAAGEIALLLKGKQSDNRILLKSKRHEAVWAPCLFFW